MTVEHAPQPAPVKKGAAVALGIAGSLPFIETLVYDTLVGTGRARLPLLLTIQVAVLCLLLSTLMVLAFVLETSRLKPLQSQLQHRFEALRKRFRKRAQYLLYILPALFLALFFGGQKGLDLALRVVPLTPFGLIILQLAAATGVIWLISWVIGSMSPGADLYVTMDQWAFAVRVSTLFYLLLIGATWRLVDTVGVNQDARLNFIIAIAKDYLLMFIIIDMLYLGTFKLAASNRLVAVFQSVGGFVQFMILCGVIAIFAIWADFATLSKANLTQTFSTEWQRRYNEVHVYLRDIGLLLVPIAVLLFWTLRRVAAETRAESLRTSSGAA